MKTSVNVKSYILVFLISMFVLTPCLTTFAHNENVQSKTHLQKDIEKVEEKLKEYNIPEKNRQILIDKYIQGEPWDSFKPEYQHLKPQIIHENYSKTIYPDGSIKVAGVIKDLSDFKQIYASGLSMKEKSALELNERLRQGGVKAEDRKKLIQKFYNGELWDNLKPEYQHVKPQIDTPHYKKTIYPDGSFTEEILRPDLSKNEPNLTPQSLGYKRASAYQEYLLVALYFEVRYRQSAETNEAQILAAENFSNRGIGATIEEIPISEGGRGHLDGWRNPTAAWYFVNAKAYNNLGSRKFWLKFYANGTETWQHHN